LGRIGADLGLYRPRGLSIDREGVLYVADTGRSRVVKLTKDGSIAGIIEGGPDWKFDQPVDAIGDDLGGVYVSEPMAGRVRHVAQDGRLLETWEMPPSDTIDAPHLVALPWGGFGLSQPWNGRVLVVSANGNQWGVLPAGAGDAMERPIGLAVDGAGGVYVIDAEAALVFKFDLPFEFP
jgi:DNA-binding beta-propeller fold protein YncE